MICPECSTQNPEDAIYCQKCGYNFVTHDPPTNPQKPFVAPPDGPTIYPEKTALYYKVQIAGVVYRNADGTNRQNIIQVCNVGDHLKLKHEPMDQDVNAVKVLNNEDLQLGFLPREIAVEVAPVLDKGEYINVTIIEKTRQPGQDGHMKRNCLIEITSEGYNIQQSEIKKSGNKTILLGCLVIIAFLVLLIGIFAIVC